jgi:hypothetical protein
LLAVVAVVLVEHTKVTMFFPLVAAVVLVVCSQVVTMNLYQKQITQLQVALVGLVEITAVGATVVILSLIL